MLCQQKRTQLPILNIDFIIENKTQTQQTKHSVTGVFSSNLDLKTAREKPSSSTQFSFVGLNLLEYDVSKLSVELA